MKNKAEMLWKNENRSDVRRQKSWKLKLKFQIHQVTHCMYDLEQVINLSEVQFLNYKVQLIRTG